MDALCCASARLVRRGRPGRLRDRGGGVGLGRSETAGDQVLLRAVLVDVGLGHAVVSAFSARSVIRRASSTTSPIPKPTASHSGWSTARACLLDLLVG